jgi:hypothetical protein
MQLSDLCVPRDSNLNFSKVTLDQYSRTRSRPLRSSGGSPRIGRSVGDKFDPSFAARKWPTIRFHFWHATAACCLPPQHSRLLLFNGVEASLRRRFQAMKDLIRFVMLRRQRLSRQFLARTECNPGFGGFPLVLPRRTEEVDELFDVRPGIRQPDALVATVGLALPGSPHADGGDLIGVENLRHERHVR